MRTVKVNLRMAQSWISHNVAFSRVQTYGKYGSTLARKPACTSGVKWFHPPFVPIRATCAVNLFDLCRNVVCDSFMVRIRCSMHPGLHNIRPARNLAIAENIATARLRIYNYCRSRNFFKLQQNEIDFAASGKFVLVNLSLWAFSVVQARMHRIGNAAIKHCFWENRVFPSKKNIEDWLVRCCNIPFSVDILSINAVTRLTYCKYR